MLPSMLSRFFYGEAKENEEERVDNGDVLKRTSVREETGDWLLISCESSAANSNGRVNSECDLDSVCSDSSWVITPAPTFRHSKGQANAANPLEDLLIEHPTMSIYRQNSRQNQENGETDGEAGIVTDNAAMDEQADGEVDEHWNQNRELVLRQNRHRRQLAAHLQIPLAQNVLYASPPKGGQKHPRVTRKAMKRHNTATSRAVVKRQVQKCGFKAGRRRC